MPLDMLVGKDEDGDPTSLWVDRRCFKPRAEECWDGETAAWDSSLPMTPKIST
jgi:hypothetical protein